MPTKPTDAEENALLKQKIEDLKRDLQWQKGETAKYHSLYDDTYSQLEGVMHVIKTINTKTISLPFKCG